MNSTIGREFHFFSLLKFAAPTIIMMIITALYTIIDSMFVSRFVGTNALSGINIVYPIINVVLAVAIMLAAGGSAVIARKMGCGELEEGRSNLSLIYLTGVVTSIIITVVGLIFMNPLVYKLGASDVLFGYAKGYLTVMLMFAPALVVQSLCQTFLVVAGKPQLGLGLSILSGLTNVALDYIFIVPLQMGIKGAALATGIGYCITALFGVIYLFSRKSNLYFTKPKLDFKMLGQSCFNGSSEMVTNIAMGIVTFLYNIMMMKYLGEDGVAAITIILYVEFLINALFMGFSMGVAPVISYNYGSGNKTQLKRIFKICISFISVGAIMAFTAAILLFPIIIRIFTDEGSNVYQIAKSGFSIFGICFLFVGMNIFASALFTAFSNGKISAIISFLRTFLFITGALIILPKIFEVNGIWMAMPVSEFLTILMSIVFLVKYRKKYHYFEFDKK